MHLYRTNYKCASSGRKTSKPQLAGKHSHSQICNSEGCDHRVLHDWSGDCEVSGIKY